MFTTTAKNTMLDALTLSHLTGFDGYPGLTGANEMAGITRVTVTMAAAASGQRASSDTPTLVIPSGLTLLWLGLADALAAGNIEHVVPKGSNGIVPYTVDDTANTIESPGHPFTDDEQVVFYGAAAPGGLVEGTPVYVVNAAADSFQVSLTEGGAAIDLTDDVDSAKLSLIVPQAYPSGGDFNLISYTARMLGGQSA